MRQLLALICDLKIINDEHWVSSNTDCRSTTKNKHWTIARNMGLFPPLQSERTLRFRDCIQTCARKAQIRHLGVSIDSTSTTNLNPPAQKSNPSHAECVIPSARQYRHIDPKEYATYNRLGLQGFVMMYRVPTRSRQLRQFGHPTSVASLPNI